MKTYKVNWNTEIDADTSYEAAKEALKIHRDPESIATIFEVDGEIIDLSEKEQ